MATRASSSRGNAFESLVQRYFYQLTQGCGNATCNNPSCATGSRKPRNPNEAAAEALFLVKQSQPRFCANFPSDTHGLNGVVTATTTSASSGDTVNEQEPMDSSDSVPSLNVGTAYDIATVPLVGLSPESSSSSTTSRLATLVSVPSVTSSSTSEANIVHQESFTLLLQKSQDTGDYKELTSLIYKSFSEPNMLNSLFMLPSSDGGSMSADECISVDLKAAQTLYRRLSSLQVDSIQNALLNAMDAYCSGLRRLRISHSPSFSSSLNHFVVFLANPDIQSPEFLPVLGKFLTELAEMPTKKKIALIRWYSVLPQEELQQLVSSLQQAITLRLLLLQEENEYFRISSIYYDSCIVSSTKALMIFFFANLVASESAGFVHKMSPALCSSVSQSKPEFMRGNESEYMQLIMALGVHPANAMKTLIPLSSFVNEELNHKLQMALDYQYDGQVGQNGEKEFAFLQYPYVLSCANKMEKLLRDNIYSMINERHRTLMHAVLTGVPDLPFLLLQIDRENVVADTLVQLETIAELNPIDLRKQLRVEFKGEEGIDEGGLQKELFQLVVEKLFDPMNGMFVFDQETRQHWFNPLSFESEDQYKLIGLLLGLAIYNNIILDIRFPVVIYRKLIGCQVVFEDLYSSHPQIARALQSLMDWDPEAGEDMESHFMLTFQVSTDMFGFVHTHNLKENGDSIPVTKDNRKEFVGLYTDWLLNSSIEKSFNAFKSGFDIVMGESHLADLFTAEEVELLVCGSNEWDFDALEQSTRYDGFTREHPVVNNFWEIVREFNDTQKKQLLAFVTGSDRIPIGGLSKLRFVIVKNGPDSDRLPTAHTCFNALMLCDYSSKDKLKERLSKAISYAKGFGMI